MAKSLQIKKKKWVQIIAPKTFNGQVIGESYVGDVADLVGRKVTVSLMTLTGEPQRQSVHVKFNIVGTKEGKATTELLSMCLLPSSAKRLVRRKRSKLSDSFVCTTKDGRFVRIKPLATTRGRVTSSLLSALRKIMRSYIALSLSKLDSENFIRLVAQKKFQSGLAKQLKKLHPMGPCEVRAFEFISEEKAKGALRILPPKIRAKPKPVEPTEAPKAAEQAA